jgi:hypothetical protein
MATVGEKIAALVEWAPVLSLLSDISAAKTNKDKAVEVIKLLTFVARKTKTPVDDDVLERIEAVLLSPAGEELFFYVEKLLTAVAAQEID